MAPQTASSHQEAFDLLARLAENRLGMDFHKRRHDRLFLMIGKRVKATFKKSILDYLSFLETNPNHPEWIEIEQILTIQKTEFFRESSQMKFFEETILPEIKHRKLKERDSKVRAWSCGCSTGEEAYTLSILFIRDFCLRLIGMFEFWLQTFIRMPWKLAKMLSTQKNHYKMSPRKIS